MDSILIFKPKIARQLLKLGHTIIDIKQHKDCKDKSVFVFKRTEKLIEDLNTLTK
jgi:hypothetical protein